MSQTQVSPDMRRPRILRRVWSARARRTVSIEASAGPAVESRLPARLTVRVALTPSLSASRAPGCAAPASSAGASCCLCRCRPGQFVGCRYIRLDKYITEHYRQYIRLCECKVVGRPSLVQRADSRGTRIEPVVSREHRHTLEARLFQCHQPPASSRRMRVVTEGGHDEQRGTSRRHQGEIRAGSGQGGHQVRGLLRSDLLRSDYGRPVQARRGEGPPRRSRGGFAGLRQPHRAG